MADNKRVVNLAWDSGLVGIDHERKDNCVPVFFGAQREYGPNEGWQEVRKNKHVKNKRKRKVARDPAQDLDIDHITDV